MIEAINGIGHAAVASNPEFRTVLAARDFTLDPESGEIDLLAPYVGAFSARTGQIHRNVVRYEAEWRREHPGEEPGPRLCAHLWPTADDRTRKGAQSIMSASFALTDTLDLRDARPIVTARENRCSRSLMTHVFDRAHRTWLTESCVAVRGEVPRCPS